MYLELMVGHRLKVIVSEPDFARLVRELWFGNPWKDWSEKLSEYAIAIFPDVDNFHPVAQALLILLLIIFWLLFLAPFAVLTIG